MSCCMLISEIIEELRNELLKWKEAFDSKGLKVNFVRTKFVVSDSVTKDGLSKSKVNPC